MVGIQPVQHPRHSGGWQSDVSLVSDGFLPFRDNVDQARKHGVRFIAQPSGSACDAEVEQACREHGIVVVRTGVPLFHH